MKTLLLASATAFALFADAPSFADAWTLHHLGRGGNAVPAVASVAVTQDLLADGGDFVVTNEPRQIA
ncbi:conserved exported protein of unknown function [Rhodovastum atsumiense]|uniref:Uncharacterized protein n=1 Tax=Rhodovastum atsumiense TaxID=504468 RepID=A0A5M6ISD9_9PROT|nr:hypothetical protein [Rhodovastum atsumiense]KAA5611224.1 hypothetical protein F1189_15765 [Rhodovastum atsumiense]CAH2602463.1 conserved exported protein of unknown function [Rhodovastum atsumiense]